MFARLKLPGEANAYGLRATLGIARVESTQKGQDKRGSCSAGLATLLPPIQAAQRKSEHPQGF